MKLHLLCAFAFVAGACAAVEGQDRGESSTEAIDAAAEPAPADAATHPPADAAAPDAQPPDAANPIDPSPPDAAVCVVPGSGTCADPIDTRGIDCAGIIAATTCGAGDDVDFVCASPPGTPDAVVRICGSWKPFGLTPGFVMQLVTSPGGDCSGAVAACGLDFGLDYSCAAGSMLLAVERADGGCGPFELTVAPSEAD